MDDFVKGLASPWIGASQVSSREEIKRMREFLGSCLGELEQRWGCAPTTDQAEVMAGMKSQDAGMLDDEDKEIQRLYDLSRRAASLCGVHRRASSPGGG